jgi:H+-translocating NAD(P) transhydrogenase subunit beta
MSDPVYLVVDIAVLSVFLLGIWWFRSPASARFGSLAVAAALIVGGFMALMRTPMEGTVGHLVVILIAMVIGATSGAIAAGRVTMTRIPAMVALQNGAGGLAAALVSLVELTRSSGDASMLDLGRMAGMLGLTIGALTFSGSLIATGRLAHWLSPSSTVLPRHNVLAGGLLGLLVIGMCLGLILRDLSPWPLVIGLGTLAIALGILVAIRVGGADMPVLISFLNALSGLAAAFCGVAIGSRLLTACGATVSASGLILTHAMCLAMNRSWRSILWAATPASVSAASVSAQPAEPASSQQEVADQSPEDQAVQALRQAGRILIVPGYGLALANAQGPAVQLAEMLNRMGKETRFAIHPIAGRMPGHMHVLLAEADVDPDWMFDLAEINPEFARTDLVVIVGACDVVNPAAIGVEGTPISGMPILLAHEAKRVLVCNLDRQPGYSGVDNPLYQDAKAILLLGDAKENLNRLIERLAAASG